LSHKLLTLDISIYIAQGQSATDKLSALISLRWIDIELAALKQQICFGETPLCVIKVHPVEVHCSIPLSVYRPISISVMANSTFSLDLYAILINK
jgi:hypothetical protein